MSLSEKESIMEEKLIEQLTRGVSQWTLRDDIRNEDDLWKNFREKLNNNNLAVLKGTPITDNEFLKIKAFINEQAITPYTAGVWLSGENGIAQIPLVRDDVTQGSIYLKALNNREIAGGDSSYEVIHQYHSDKQTELDENRRFDVTLLINGMPMIHIELKNRAHPYMDAFRQIQKYSEQGHFRGLFGLVQMFVVTNGANTKYIAAANYDQLNEKFLTGWLDKDNNPVEDYLDFAKEVLCIPTAHMIVGKCSVLDASREQLILLRPYQIHAVEAIRQASIRGESGFIWHTTGSGKTLTSYNVTKYLLDVPNVDKTLFLIDRKALDTQTTTEFQSYARSDSVDVDETENTVDLENKLMDGQKHAIVTTIQKLQNIIRKYNRNDIASKPGLQRKKVKMQKLHIAFVVDECHRTVSPEMKRILEKWFSDSLWYGFTGTPIFAENKKKVQGDLPDTTEKLYGKCLHKYTIKEAIKNNAVLGFNVEFHDNLTDDELRNYCAALHICSKAEIECAERIDLEYKFLQYYKSHNQDFYGTEEHRREVVKYIINHCAGKFGLDKGEGNTYDAMLTVPSIIEAQAYYSLFKKMIAEGVVSENIKKRLPDFPKIAITYTVGENQDGAMANQRLMKESLQDYNDMFGTNFGLDDGLAGYNKDLQERLARKETKFHVRSQQLDLVIVVDRLLTGFDAPCLSTLFVDRPPMPPQNIVQAFSRTNRIFDKAKQYGQILIFRTPAIYKKAIDDAIYLYSAGGSQSDIMAPTYAEAKLELKRAITELRKAAPTPSDVDSFTDRDEKVRFAKAYQDLDKALSAIRVYNAWQPSYLETAFHLTYQELDEYRGKYQNVIEDLKSTPNGGAGGDEGDDGADEPIDIDIEYELEVLNKAVVNYKYIVALIQRYIPAEGAMFAKDADKNADVIREYLRTLAKSNPKLATIIEDVWKQVKGAPLNYVNQSVMVLIEKEVRKVVISKLVDVSNTWYASFDDIHYHAMHYKPEDKLMDINLDYDKYKLSGGTLSKLKFRKAAREAIRQCIEEEVLPLRDFL